MTGSNEKSVSEKQKTSPKSRSNDCSGWPGCGVSGCEGWGLRVCACARMRLCACARVRVCACACAWRREAARHPEHIQVAKPPRRRASSGRAVSLREGIRLVLCIIDRRWLLEYDEHEPEQQPKGSQQEVAGESRLRERERADGEMVRLEQREERHDRRPHKRAHQRRRRVVRQPKTPEQSARAHPEA
jgi:hypothetical protein